MGSISPLFDMDTSISLEPEPPTDFVPPTLVPSNGHTPPSHLLSDPPQMFSSKPDHLNGTITSMHVLASNQPNLTSPSYLDPADTIDPVAVIHPTSSIPEFPSYPPPAPFENDMAVEPIASQVSAHPSPESQMPSAHHHGVALPYVGSTSSLQSALKPVTTPARSRANTVGSYVGDSPRAPIHPQIGDAFPAAGESGLPPGENPLVAGGAILREIAQTAESANQACRMSQFTLNDGSPRVTPFDEGQQDYFSHPGDQGITFLTSADERRKRCLSTLEEERPLKSLKAEPQDNVPLFPVSSSHPVLPQSPPPSRPHSPTYPFNGTAHISPTYSNGYSGAAEAMLNSVLPPSLPPHRSFWSEGIIPTRQSHSHSLSTNGIPANDPHFARLPPMYPSAVNGAPIGRMSRSGSINSTFGTPFSAMDHSKSYPTPAAHPQDAWNANAPPTNSKDTSAKLRRTRSQSVLAAHPGDCEDSDDDEGDDESPPASGHSYGMDHPTSSSTSSSDVPQEYRADVDRIFFQFLNRICSNLEATDTKGEAIHQTLMAKKMQRLDESPDFRPFKFRIQAFTNAFLDELARHGFPEEKIPMKKVRNYLWKQPHILRFNEDGKKAKSKGNHIWNVEAKKIGDSKWEFRPFYRKLAGNPPSVAYCGLTWKWAPRVWDPQASWQNIPITFSSPYLPSWLSWENNVLSGSPPNDAQSCEITVNAAFTLDGQERHLSHTFTINIAPVSSIDSNSSFSRSTSSADLTELPSRRVVHRPPPLQVEESGPARVSTVLHNVAQRVADQTTHVKCSYLPSQQHDLGDLSKQQQVIQQTISAYDKALNGNTPMDTQRLAQAVQDVVVQAAQTVVAPMSRFTGRIPTDAEAIQQADVNQMSAGVQGALAHVVKNTAPSTSEVEVMIATKEVLVHSREQMHSSGPVGVFPPLI
ncbi:hypothetical protein CPB85DRAFT_1428129 [Mucidula mucida]|nr:hypothetical protein CPB85DRAFT_1428129 [Mucidula mucida]